MGISLTGTEVRSSGTLTLASLADQDVTIGEVSNAFVTVFGTEETFSIGSGSSSNKLFTQKNDGTTNGITDIIGILHSTSGTPANGIGTGIGFNIEGAGGSVQGGRIASVLTDVSNDSEDGEFRFFAMANGTLSTTSILSLSNSGISGSGVKDEDNMSSNSATHLATQQSIKAYTDSQGLSSANITLSSVANNDVLQYNSSTSKWVNRTRPTAGLVTLTGSETVTNKTLTSPVINTPNLTGGTVNDITSFGIKQSSTSYEMQIAVSTSQALQADRVLTIDVANAARTLTLGGDLSLGTSFALTGNNTVTLGTTGSSSISLTLPESGTIATLAGVEIFTNKSLSDSTTSFIDNADATKKMQFQISGVAGGATRILTVPNFDGTIATLAGTETLSNKTLNSGSITSGFGSINIGSSAFSTTGVVTTGQIVITSDLNTTAQNTNWDLFDNSATALSFDASGKGPILTIDTRNTVEKVLVNGGLEVTGDLTVSGTTTTVSSTTVTIADPIFNLGGTSAPGSDDNKDRGISFRWHNGSAAKIGFFGFDDSTGKMTFIPDATINSEVVSGTVGTIVAAIEGNTDTATSAATWTTARTLSFTGDVTGSGSVNGSANVATALTIQANAVQAAMVHQDVIGGRTELTSGQVATGADFLLLWDATDNAFKKVKPDNLGVSGLASGSTNEVQYNNGNAFAGATNVEIKNNSLALKEQSTPNTTTAFGMVYAKGNPGELYYRNDTHNETQITRAGALAGGGVFQGAKAFLSANTSISNDSLTTVSAWTEVFDVGTLHSTSSNTERFTFPVAGYYSIQVNQTWALDADGYREAVVQYRDNSGSSTSVILTDRVLSSSSETTSSSNATITLYVDDTNDYVYLQVRQTSGGALNLIGAADEMTSISIIRLDVATQNSSGASGSLQFSDGAGSHSADASNLFWDDSNNRLGIGTNTPTTTLQVNGVATFESYIDFNLISAPSSPATEDARMYLKQVDANNNAIAVKLQKAGSIQEVEITSPGAICEECGNRDGSRDPVYDFERSTMILHLFCGHTYEIDMPQWRRIK